MIEIDNRTKTAIDSNIIEKIANSLTDKDIELLIVDKNTIQQLNATYRNKNAPTDVLSFPLAQTPGSMLGSIVICADVAESVAKRYGHTLQEEIALLFLHGLLHLLGFDHEIDQGQMRQKEQEIIEKFNLPTSLIVRTDDE
ncbi:rRNA maturation RNase YbeY [Nitratiruptor sp. YY09-18]|uniref:rRNA maturation RNase YbeY n=1 Tax=Nitratiruptor sp. YY09-18 TaxID=2724901 RepID=UPI0019157C0B|nr:rRNA maturation RNase YbeY [Nitratiruptor sp. YY09-18]BCD68002.1 probable rRNA maturation factor [Nitratiruptor sp. YY09-18]